MSIEQTNQLILLILNSVLMALLSAVLLGGAWLRQNTLSLQLHRVRSRYRQVMKSSGMVSNSMASGSIEATGETSSPSESPKNTLRADLRRIRDQRQRLNNQYLWSRTGMLILHLALLIFGLSLFALALRSLLSLDGLIAAALVLFTVGAAGLLTGTGCILIDLVQGNSEDESLGHSLAKAMVQVGQKIAWITIQAKSARARQSSN
jgi:hypothetical protein